LVRRHQLGGSNVRRTLLSAEQRTRLFGIRTEASEMAKHYVLSAEDLALIRAKRRSGNRLGLAVELSYCGIRAKASASASMRLKASIEGGAVLPSVILRKLVAAGPGNALSRALRTLGRIERTLFTLQWLSDPDLRQRSHAGLNKGEASNSLRRAVFFHRQGEIRDRTFENQSFRASGLSVITAAIVHWNTVYLDRAVRQLLAQGVTVPDELLAHVAPLGWEHIALTGDYVWSAAGPEAGFRPLRECSRRVPTSGGLACSFEQIVRLPQRRQTERLDRSLSCWYSKQKIGIVSRRRRSRKLPRGGKASPELREGRPPLDYGNLFGRWYPTRAEWHVFVFCERMAVNRRGGEADENRFSAALQRRTISDISALLDRGSRGTSAVEAAGMGCPAVYPGQRQSGSSR
jgi:Tn3 transposase DDE domain/Domain of unknown function (DUF4158)